MKMFNRYDCFKAALLCAALYNIPAAMAETPQATATKAFGNPYSQVQAVSGSQAQVVYYRPKVANTKPGAAHVYVDREFHTGLLPGGYTAFCVAPGQHTLGAYLNDAPGYKGKNDDTYTTQLSGGTTYFLRVTEAANGMPQAVARADAERELAATRQQVHAVSRASTVQACDYLPAAAAKPHKDYVLSGDVLFGFGKSGSDAVSSAGRKAVHDLANQLKTDNAPLKQIDVMGHTDALGSPSANQALGLKRAQTVRRMLIDAGLPAARVHSSSAGASEPVSHSCKGTRAQLIKCYAPDRRVVVRVSTQD